MREYTLPVDHTNKDKVIFLLLLALDNLDLTPEVRLIRQTAYYADWNWNW